MKSSKLILAILLSLSFQKAERLKTIMLFNDNLEVLNGNVKQLVEIKHDHTTESEYPLSFIITTNLDKRGEITSEQKKDIVAEKLEETKYFYKYDAKGKKVKTIVKSERNGTEVYKYDQEERINEMLLYWRKGKVKGGVMFKYDNTGNMIETDPTGGVYYYKVKYKYDNKHNVIEEEELSENNSQGIKTIDWYKSFDTRGNWLKKIRVKQVNRTSFKNSTYPADTITRKITYY